MLIFVMLTKQGLCETNVPDGLTEAKLNGCDGRIVYRSGWLYFDRDFRITCENEPLNSPVPVHARSALYVKDETMNAILMVREVSGFVEREILVDKQKGFSLTVGRSSANDVFYNDAAVSRCHGRFSAEEDGLVYVDMSMNGSYINGEHVNKQRRHLCPGDMVRIPPLLTIRVDADSVAVIQPG